MAKEKKGGCLSMRPERKTSMHEKEVFLSTRSDKATKKGNGLSKHKV